MKFGDTKPATSSRNIAKACLAIPLFLSLSSTAWAQTETPRPPLSPDGTVSLPAMDVPDTPLMSKQGNDSRTGYMQRIRDAKLLARPDFMDQIFAPYVTAAKAMFPLKTRTQVIAGVRVIEYTPVSGVSAANRDKLIIHLHGGGFINCFDQCGPLEAMPVAFKTGYRTISLDYRQAPKYKFPAASEDVAAVYREVLKTYKPSRIAIFGCSAGGSLTGQSLAWFATHDLPMPAAAGIACSGGGNLWDGDSRYLSGPAGEASNPPSPARSNEIKIPYFSEADPNDPLVSPSRHPEILKRFPPTIIHTGTRAFDMSAAIYLHQQLVRLDREAELHVTEGGRHGFHYDPTIPEADDVTNQIAKFFRTHLTR